MTKLKKRLLYFEILEQINHKNALVITGMRQVGKTTVMRQVFDKINEKKIWFDFDNPLDQKVFEDVDYNNIYRYLAGELDITPSVTTVTSPPSGAKFHNERVFVFIDEIQNFPEITKIIKYLIDHYRVKFVVTGSASFYLKNLFPESLSGRKFLYQLDPLSFQEYLYFNDVKTREQIQQRSIDDCLKPVSLVEYKKYDRYYHEYLNYGGFPEVVVTKSKNTRKQILKNIFASFFEKDLRILSDYKDIRELRDLILLLVPRVGSEIQIIRLASELGINRPKVYEYLEFLQASFFIKLIPKFSKSIDRGVAGGKKVYFSDNGILRTVGEVNASQLFENMLSNQLSEYGDVSFYNKRNTAEIDFIVDKQIALEVKLTGVKNDLEKVKKISEKIGIRKSHIIAKKYSEEDGVVSAFRF